ncbi:MAG: hypothetical protein AAB074_01055 [Planctomycetota bacterium]
MRNLTVISSITLVLCSLQARAQVTEVFDNAWSECDVAALKGGEWVELEALVEYPGMSVPSKKARNACVKVDADYVWIESSVADQVTCYQIARKDRRVLKAWKGNAGEEGKELTVKPAPVEGPTPAAGSECAGTGKISKEKISFGGKDYECEKVEVDQVMKMSGMEIKSRTTTWYSDGYPFKFYIDPDAKPAPAKDSIKWEGDGPSKKGGIVKMVTETNGGKSTTQVIATGTDAKPTLKLK